MKFAAFAYGFRPFFLGVGLSALVLVPLWAANFTFGLTLATDWPPMLWHAHEMLFGFVVAAIAGFLLTSVPSWTGRRGFAGPPLVLLAATWLLGRLVAATSTAWPFALVAVVDLAFLPALAALLAWPLLRERNRNTPLLPVLLVLWACNAAFHLGLLRDDLDLARRALLAAVDLVLLLVTVIGGRITPSFTAAALRLRGVEGVVRARKSLTVLAVTLMVLVALVDVAWPGSTLAGWIALAAAVVQAARLAQWQGWRVGREPILWILHLAYLWLPAGLALKALWLLAAMPVAAAWLHALTVGAIATMILGVMTRVSLGHTGRALRLHPLVTAACLLVSAAALARILGAWLPGLGYAAAIVLSAALWTLAFASFLWIYTPILATPRADGRPG
ncbi:MAG: NnrS family protein [Steroidobacteraceae bacterium]